MKRLMKAECYKFRHEASVWVISGILTVCACLSIFTGVYSCAEDAFVNLGKDAMVLYFACAIYAGVSLADGFSNRTVLHILACGYRRPQFLLAKLLHYLFGCTWIVICYLAASTAVAAAALGIRSSPPALMWHMLRSILAGLPLYFAMAMVFFLFGIATRKGSLTIAASVSFSVLCVVLTNRAYSTRPHPQQTWLRLLPTMQLPSIYAGASLSGDYCLTLLLSTAAILILFSLCIPLMQKAEL